MGVKILPEPNKQSRLSPGPGPTG